MNFLKNTLTKTALQLLYFPYKGEEAHNSFNINLSVDNIIILLHSAFYAQ